MADSSTPLLTNLEDHEDINSKQTPQKSPSSLTFDNILEQSLSDFGISQLFQLILVGLSLTFDSHQIFITVFTDLYPTWHCLNHTICNQTSNICDLPRTAWDWDNNGFKGKSVISDFNLQCSSSFLRNLPTSAFYIGSIVGGFSLSLIPESFLGRKKLLFLSTFSMSLTGISIFFSSNIWIYIFMKFFIGFARSQTGTYALVLISERVSTKWRPRALMIPFTLFVLGFMSLSGIAYTVQNLSWRILYLCTSIPAAIHSVLLYFLALESPRWLHLQGNNKEAIEILKRISPAGKKPYLESISSQLPSHETLEQSQRYSIKDLFTRKWAFQRILVVMIIIFGLGISYYGVPLAVRDINVNLYISETLNAVVELPSFIITPILLERFSRRNSVFVNCLIGGVAGILCFVSSLLGKFKIAFALELASFFCARIGFNLMAIYIVELFPTCVRNCATTMLRQSLVMGGACSPIIASIGRNFKIPSLSFAIFGFAMSGFGAFALLLPETKGFNLCDTMESQEERDQTLKTTINRTV